MKRCNRCFACDPSVVYIRFPEKACGVFHGCMDRLDATMLDSAPCGRQTALISRIATAAVAFACMAGCGTSTAGYSSSGLSSDSAPSPGVVALQIRLDPTYDTYVSGMGTYNCVQR